MRFPRSILLLVLSTTLSATTSLAFAPGSSSLVSSKSKPSDFIVSGRPKIQQRFTLTNTLRWEIRSTLSTSDEKVNGGGSEELAAFPTQLGNGIWDIQTPEQHT